VSGRLLLRDCRFGSDGVKVRWVGMVVDAFVFDMTFGSVFDVALSCCFSY
jgi:hypothetical protein